MNPVVHINILELPEKDAKRLVEELRKAYILGINELDSAQEEQNLASAKVENIKKSINHAQEEKERFKELYISELQRKKDVKKYISSQKTLKKTLSYTTRTKMH